MPYLAAKSGRLGVLLVWAVTALAYAGKAWFMAPSTPLILDSDDAMRLVEVRDLLDGQSWFDLVQHRLDTPYGTLMHWSRLVDLPEAIGLFLLRPLAGAAAPLWLAAIWPLLLLGPLLFLLVRIARLLGGEGTFWPVLLLTPLCLITLGEFAPGRVDHHAVQILLTLAMTYGILQGPAAPRWAALAGACAAAAITVGVEGVPIVGAAGLAVALAAIASPRFLPTLRDFTLGLAVALALGLATTVSPADWLLPRLDVVSIIYVALAAAAALVAGLVPILPAPTWPRRALAFATLGGVALAMLVALYPQLLAGPYAALDSWLVRHWLLKISESQSFLTSLAADPVYPLAVTVPVLVAIGFALWSSLLATADRWRWIILAVLLVAGLAVMAVQIRAARIVTPLALPIDAALIARLYAWSRTRKGPLGPAAITVAAIASTGLAVAIFAALLPFESPPAAAAGSRQACLQPAAFASLAAAPPARLMAPIDLGAHLLLYTPHSVVGADYHRDQRGLLDSFAAFNASAAEALAILATRGITRVVVCPAMLVTMGLDDAAPDSLVATLARGETPSWLVEDPNSSPLRIFSLRPQRP